jgi:hypothetical protein
MRELTNFEVRAVIVVCIIKKNYIEVDNPSKRTTEPVDIIRELAKRPEIRAIWSVAKASKVPMFEHPVTEWNSLQRRLVYWLSVYDSVEESYERPPQRVIEDNFLLDLWFEDKAKEYSQQYESNWAKGNKLGKTAYDHEEVFEL